MSKPLRLTWQSETGGARVTLRPLVGGGYNLSTTIAGKGKTSRIITGEGIDKIIREEFDAACDMADLEECGLF